MPTFVTRERVAFTETDAAGIMHFSTAMRFFEIGEREALRGLGVRVGDARRGGQELPRLHVNCDYRQPLYYDDEIEIRTECLKIGNSSVLWQFHIYRDEELCIFGQMTVCTIDTVSRRPIRVPDSWREYLLAPTEERQTVEGL